MKPEFENDVEKNELETDGVQPDVEAGGNEPVVADEASAAEDAVTESGEQATEHLGPSVNETGEIIAAIGVHEATAANVLPSPQELAEMMPGVEEIAKEPLKQRRTGLIIGIVAGAIAVLALLGALVFGVYFAFFSYTTVDIFTDVELVYDGANGYASVEDGVKPYVAPSGDQALSNGLKSVISYSSDATNLKNGDVITVTAVVDQAKLDEYRVKPESLTQAFTVSGLSTVPAKYSEIPGEADLRAQASSFVEGYRQADIDAVLSKVSGSTLTSDDLKLHAIAYKADGQNCRSGETSYEERCGTIQYIYDHQVNTESPGYTHTYGTWRMYGLTNIQVLEDGTLFQTTNYVVSMDNFDTNHDGFIDDGEMKAGYEQLGFTFVVQ